MTDFLKKIKLIDGFSITVLIPVHQVEIQLKKIIGKTTYSPFAGFSSKTPEFMGEINKKGFKIRRAPKAFSKNDLSIEAIGTFKEEDGRTKIKVQIIGFDVFMKLIYTTLSIMILFGGYLFLKSGVSYSQDNLIPLMGGPIIIMMLIFIPYFQNKRGVEKLKYDLKREIKYLSDSQEAL